MRGSLSGHLESLTKWIFSPDSFQEGAGPLDGLAVHRRTKKVSRCEDLPCW